MALSAADRRTAAAFGLLVVLVGTNLVAIRYSNRELPPFWDAGARFALAAAVFALIVAIRRPRGPSRREIAAGVAYGLFAFAGFFAFVYLGLVRAPAAIGQTVLALNPLVTMFLAAAIGMERLRPRAIVGAAISLIGIAVAFGAASTLDVPATSLLALLAATTSFAAGGIVVRRVRGAEPITQNLIATLVGSAVLLGISAIAGEPWPLPATSGTWLAFAYLVGPGTVVVFLLLLYLLRRWTATAVSYQFVLAPMVSISLAALLLGESIGPSVLVGAILVIVGVYVGAIARPAGPAGAPAPR
jgi:drug/metabolite transporter (DMT)-like permease